MSEARPQPGRGPSLPASGRDRLIVALDVPGRDEALALCRRLGDEVRWVKIGLELFCSAGPSVVQEIADSGKDVFLDLKFHDIPNTVAGAVRAASRLPVRLLNVHAAAGEAAMRAAGEAAEARPDLGVIAVTRLTSDASGGGGDDEVLRMADAAARAGLFGVVCPAAAASALRERYGDRLARVCPGIRPAEASVDDQVHVSTPEGAVRSGAHWIVVGRPITRSDDPAAAARAISRGI